MADECSKGFISVMIVYAIALMYLGQTHTKFWGYIMLIIAYIFSSGYTFQYQEQILSGVTTLSQYLNKEVANIPFISKLGEWSVVSKIFILFALCIVFFNLYSLIKILNAYYFKSSKIGSFDLILSDRYKKKLKIFDWSFIVGNVAWFTFIYYLIAGSATGNKLVLFLIAFICVWIGLGVATEFSYIKRE